MPDRAAVEPGATARSRRARHRRGRRAARLQQSHPGCAGLAAHPARPLRGRSARAARSGGPQCRGVRAGSRLPGRAATERGGTARRHAPGIRCLVTDDETRRAARGRARAGSTPTGASSRRRCSRRRSRNSTVRSPRSTASWPRGSACSMRPGTRASSGSSRRASRSAASPRHRVRAGRPGLGQGLRAFGARRARARRAGCDRDASPGPARKIRRSRDGGGYDAARGALREFERAFAAEVERWIDRRARRRTCTPMARCWPASSTLATATALRDGGPWGSGFPEPCSTALRVIETRIVAERHLKLRLRAPSARRSMRSRFATSTTGARCRGADQRRTRLSHRRRRIRRRAQAAARHGVARTGAERT